MFLAGSHFFSVCIKYTVADIFAIRELRIEKPTILTQKLFNQYSQSNYTHFISQYSSIMLELEYCLNSLCATQNRFGYQGNDPTVRIFDIIYQIIEIRADFDFFPLGNDFFSN